MQITTSLNPKNTLPEKMGKALAKCKTEMAIRDVFLKKCSFAIEEIKIRCLILSYLIGRDVDHLKRLDILNQIHTSLNGKPILSLLDTTQRTHKASAVALRGEQTAEAHMSEIVITRSDDPKPIVATFGCGPCVAVGGFESVNRIAFVAHFAREAEVRQWGSVIFYHIQKLASVPITTPIQLYLRGGKANDGLIKAIRVWMKIRSDIPMEIVSERILKGAADGAESLSIDSRTGEVEEYDPMQNPFRRTTVSVGLSFNAHFESGHMAVAYVPKHSPATTASK